MNSELQEKSKKTELWDVNSELQEKSKKTELWDVNSELQENKKKRIVRCELRMAKKE